MLCQVTMLYLLRVVICYCKWQSWCGLKPLFKANDSWFFNLYYSFNILLFCSNLSECFWNKWISNLPKFSLSDFGHILAESFWRFYDYSFILSALLSQGDAFHIYSSSLCRKYMVGAGKFVQTIGTWILTCLALWIFIIGPTVQKLDHF